jgi:hypothetical protein
VALFCKQRSSAALARSDCESFLKWHSLWHYILPLGAVLGQLLLHQPCDYAMDVRASCAVQQACLGS